MNIVREMVLHLEYLGHGEKDRNLFWGTMPTTPDTAVCVYSSDSGYAGSPDGARLQIITRAKSDKTAYELSQAIAEDLAEFDGYLYGDGAQASIDITNASIGLGNDDNKRPMYSTNIVVRYCDA